MSARKVIGNEVGRLTYSDCNSYEQADAILAALAETHPGCLLDPASGEMVRAEPVEMKAVRDGRSFEVVVLVPVEPVCQASGLSVQECEARFPAPPEAPITDTEPVCPDCGGEKVIRETIYGPVDVDVNDHPCPTCDKGDNNGK